MSERRRFARIPRDRSACRIRFGDAEFDGFLVEESIGGLKVSGLDLLALPENQPVEIIYHNVANYGICRTANRDDDDTLAIGVMLKDHPVLAEPQGLLVSCFFSAHGHWLACSPLQVNADDSLEIQLFDGKELTVSRQAVKAFTLFERRAELKANPSMQSKLAELYSSRDTVDDVLNFEFCVSAPVEELQHDYSMSAH